MPLRLKAASPHDPILDALHFGRRYSSIKQRHLEIAMHLQRTLRCSRSFDDESLFAPHVASMRGVGKRCRASDVEQPA